VPRPFTPGLNTWVTVAIDYEATRSRCAKRTGLDTLVEIVITSLQPSPISYRIAIRSFVVTFVVTETTIGWLWKIGIDFTMDQCDGKYEFVCARSFAGRGICKLVSDIPRYRSKQRKSLAGT
jgi:hypothetical protein